MEKRSEQANIRLSPAELAAISDKANSAKTTVTEFVRAAALNKRTPVQKSTAVDFETRNELRRIGVNLNQIARVLNAGGTANADELNALCGKLDILFDEWLGHGSQSRQFRP